MDKESNLKTNSKSDDLKNIKIETFNSFNAVSNKRKPSFNFANIITFSRFVLVIIFLVIFIVFYALFSNETTQIKLGNKNIDSLSSPHIYIFNIIFLVIFLLAILTDILDGYVARKLGISSNFGKLTDPLIDKLLINFYTLAIILAYPSLYQVWWVLIIFLFRDFLVDWGRMLLAKKNVVVNANFWGKAKTFFQSLFIIFALVNLFFRDTDLQTATISIGAIAAFVSLFSGLIYLYPVFKQMKHFFLVEKEK
ncbi:CDP-diacylglycerol--glycerol-3-phosphate 3-phosphatidyltransferase [Mycoplasma sp. SG1]|uniref:CDP-diacylglycerol--glycerol-3-phosphate 3-phosphatidyltransferase n=1 Tax=Mycoplasma sp. SG1 TaxID=2810348 RepID=UPI002024F690|nr:CDP-diacylglycerol--glycerol-3-phosphate 3-phosphatidyltransferase [Mycoplasma sp. SG1]URM53128.1 CDP-diacylglycerol--glycerol-3-phosphate 3-phosphatidyltransferase [Mycoplasma sp. SG1]